MKRQSQSGFAVGELVVALVIVVAVVVVGFFVWHEHNKSSSMSANTSSNYQSPTTSTPAAPQINNASDLNTAMSALNQTSVSSSNVDSSQLSTYSTGF